MNTVWFPIPVSLFLRRVVNVISTLGITHHYLHTRSEVDQPEGPDARNGSNSIIGDRRMSSRWRPLDGIRSFEWPGWLNEEVKLTGSGSRGTRTVMSGDLWRDSISERVVQTSGISISWPRWRWPTASRLTALFSEQTEENTQDSENSSKFEYQSHPRNTPPPKPRRRPPPRDNSVDPETLDTIHRLIVSPVLYDPVRTPRYPIVLCHGLYGFDVRGPSAFPGLRMNYWSSILHILRKIIGAEVIVTAVPGTGSIASRSENMDRFLQQRAPGRGLNFMAHSMGGLDCRHLISHIKPTEYTPLSLTTIATPHRGSVFMDWCTEYLGLGRTQAEKELVSLATKSAAASLEKSASDPSMVSASGISEPKSKQSSSSLSMSSLASLPSSFTTLLLSMFDSPAYANLTTTYLNTIFNPSTPDDPRVKYFSIAGRQDNMNVWHPLWLPKVILDGAEEKDRVRLQREARASGVLGDDASPAPWDREDLWGHDGLVSVQSARWGEFLGTMEGCDHWQLRGASGIELGMGIGAGTPSTSSSSGHGGESWGLGDWGRFVRAWTRANKTQKAKEEQKEDAGGLPREGRWEKREQQKEKREAEEDRTLKSSTDRLSVVFDWLANQVPTDSIPSLGLRSNGGGSTSSAAMQEKDGGKEASKKKSERRSDLESDADLERFYVALTRKLYDEGL